MPVFRDQSSGCTGSVQGGGGGRLTCGGGHQPAGLVDLLGLDIGQSSLGLGGSVEVPGARRASDPRGGGAGDVWGLLVIVRLADMQRHDQLFQGGVASSFANAIDGALQLPRPRLHRR